jgi:hypothetical protein
MPACVCTGSPHDVLKTSREAALHHGSRTYLFVCNYMPLSCIESSWNYLSMHVITLGRYEITYQPNKPVCDYITHELITCVLHTHVICMQLHISTCNYGIIHLPSPCCFPCISMLLRTNTITLAWMYLQVILSTSVDMHEITVDYILLRCM